MKDLEIYGTLGPSCNDECTIKQMFDLGMTGMRLNLSHCNLWDRADWINAFHKANPSGELMIDLKGPELRLPPDDEIIYLPNGSSITFSGLHWPKALLNALEVNDHILIDDSKLELEVIELFDGFISCKVIRGGYLEGSKSIAIKNKSITGNLLNENDYLNLRRAKEFGVTSIMQPFVRSKEDLIELKRVLHELQLDDLRIFAKIENLDGFNNLDTLLPYCDCIVIARGDLGNAVGITKLPIIQAQIEKICNQHHHPYMVVTEMLASMKENEIPTRAEANDVFQAVYNGASSIMLTGETANGKYPIRAMQYFVEIAKESQNFKKTID